MSTTVTTTKRETTIRRHQIVIDTFSELIGKKDTNGKQLYSMEKILSDVNIRTGYSISYIERILAGNC